MVYETPVRSDELYHFGTKGMRWGVRRYQNPDGSYTAAGRRRYGIQDVKEALNIKTNNKNEESDSKETKSKLTDEDKQRIRKGLMIAAGVTIGALATYTVAKKIGRDFTSVELDKGTTLQNIHRLTPSDHAGLYVSFKKKDMAGYDKAMNAHYATKGAHKIFKDVGEAREKIKAPSNHEAKKIFNELKKNDPEFRKEAIKASTQGIFTGNGGAADKLFGGYDTFNRVAEVTPSSPAVKKFHDELKKRGYNALIDVNDQKYSGFGMERPLILLDKNNFDVKHTTERVLNNANFKVGQNELRKRLNYQAGKKFVLTGLTAGATYTGVKAAKEEREYQKKQKK